MKVLWIAGSATVHEIRAQLPPQHPLAYTTVMTVMDRLARKGIVEREKRGRAHLYRPLIPKDLISERALSQLIENFFGGSREELRKHLDETRMPILQVAQGGHDTTRPDAASAPLAEGEVKLANGIDASLL